MADQIVDYENMKTEQYEKCPKCGKRELSADFTEYSFGTAWRIVECTNCGFEYQEVFTFLHNEDMDSNVLDEYGEPLDGLGIPLEFGYFASMITEVELSDLNRMLVTETKQWKIDLIKEQIRTLS